METCALLAFTPQEAMRNAFGFGGFGGGFQRTARRGPAVVRTAMRISFDEAVKGTTKQVGGRAPAAVQQVLVPARAKVKATS